MTYWAVGQVGLPWPVGVLAAIVTAAILGILVERLALRPLIGEPIISIIMVTIGLSSLVAAIISLIWGTQSQPFPAFIPNANVTILGAVTPMTASTPWRCAACSCSASFSSSA